jgi:hypothetical protein
LVSDLFVYRLLYDNGPDIGCQELGGLLSLYVYSPYGARYGAAVGKELSLTMFTIFLDGTLTIIRRVNEKPENFITRL